jgi:hypothetical protein
MAASSDPGRPSAHEICKKVRDALLAIHAGRRQAPFTKHLIGDCQELNIYSAQELWGCLVELMKEILDANPVACYAGCHPPTRSYEAETRNMELWAYRWSSPSAGRRMYLKFAMKQDHQGNWWYIHVDVHTDRPGKEG